MVAPGMSEFVSACMYCVAVYCVYSQCLLLVHMYNIILCTCTCLYIHMCIYIIFVILMVSIRIHVFFQLLYR